MSARNIKAVVFDAGGVLVLESPSAKRMRLYNQFHLEPDYSLLNIGKISLSQMFGRILKRGVLTKEEVGELKKLILTNRKFNRELYRYGLSLKSRGLKIGICSNNSRTVFDTWNRKYKFTRGYAPNVRVSARVHLIKPKKEIFMLMCRLLKVKPEEMIFVDDRISNVNGAAKLGIHALHFKNNNQEIIRKIEALLK